MIRTFQFGYLKITGITEFFGPTHDPTVLYPKYDPAVVEKEKSWLVPDHYHPDLKRLYIAINIWVVQTHDRIIIIDTGVGNRKKRVGIDRMDQLNTLFLTWLAAAGVQRDKVTDVINTHLHLDHVGWNTMLVDGKWVPTFPNARYYIPEREYNHFVGSRKNGVDLDGGSLEDSVFPVEAAGQLQLLTDEKHLFDLFEIVQAPGHTPGMINLWFKSGGRQGVFCADIFHHPLQIVRPDWNTLYCMLPEDALKTRADFLKKAEETKAVFFPCHFVLPHAGTIKHNGNSYEYVPLTTTQL